jgi:hypothetical protein
VRRVARTIADLAGHDGALTVDAVAAALALRTDPTFLDVEAPCPVQRHHFNDAMLD